MPTDMSMRTGRVTSERRRSRRHHRGFGCPATAGEPSEPACDLRVRFQAGDESTVRELYAEYGRQMYAVAMSALGDRQLAAECVQIAFLKAWQAAPRFDVTREFGPWLATITRRAAVDLLSPRLRDAVKLVYVDQLSHAEVAERLGIPVGTVKSRSFAAHRRLAGVLADVVTT